MSPRRPEEPVRGVGSNQHQDKPVATSSAAAATTAAGKQVGGVADRDPFGPDVGAEGLDWDDDGYGGMTAELPDGSILEVAPVTSEAELELWTSDEHKWSRTMPDGTRVEGRGSDREDAMNQAEGGTEEPTAPDDVACDGCHRPTPRALIAAGKCPDCVGVDLHNYRALHDGRMKRRDYPHS